MNHSSRTALRRICPPLVLILTAAVSPASAAEPASPPAIGHVVEGVEQGGTLTIFGERLTPDASVWLCQPAPRADQVLRSEENPDFGLYVNASSRGFRRLPSEIVAPMTFRMEDDADIGVDAGEGRGSSAALAPVRGNLVRWNRIDRAKNAVDDQGESTHVEPPAYQTH